jgi:hypothetical protein
VTHSTEAKRSAGTKQMRNYEKPERLLQLKRINLKESRTKKRFKHVKTRKHVIFLFNKHKTLALLLLRLYGTNTIPLKKHSIGAETTAFRASQALYDAVKLAEDE